MTALPTIRVPNVYKIYWQEQKDDPPPALIDGYVEYTVSEKMKKLWDSLSERERETLCSLSEGEHKDLREVLASRMAMS